MLSSWWLAVNSGKNQKVTDQCLLKFCSQLLIDWWMIFDVVEEPTPTNLDLQYKLSSFWSLNTNCSSHDLNSDFPVTNSPLYTIHSTEKTESMGNEELCSKVQCTVSTGIEIFHNQECNMLTTRSCTSTIAS